MRRTAPRSLALLAAALTLAVPASPLGAQDPSDRARAGALGPVPSPRLPAAPPPGVPQNFGVIVETFPSPDVRPAGLGYDGDFLWLITDGAVKTLWKLDPADGSVVDSFPAPAATFAFGLDHAADLLWGDTGSPDEIYSADPADGAVGDRFASPFASPNGVAWDGADLWHTGFDEDLALVDDADGALIRTIPAPGLRAPRDLAWDGTSLWLVDANLDPSDSIYQIDPADGTVLLQFVPVGDPLTLLYGATYDGQFLWLTDLIDGQIHKMELALKVGIWVSGSCPGPVELDLFGATPGATVAIARGTGTGTFELPGGPCAGTEIGLDGVTPLGTVILDENGEATLTGTLGAGACGLHLQAVDLDNCTLSAVARTPKE